MERNTPQRLAIEACIKASSRPLLPGEILQAAQQHIPTLGIATVYRTLKALTQDGCLQMVHLPGDSPRFEATQEQHHHHFKCQQCTKVFDIFMCLDNIHHLAPAGYQVYGHDITLFGLCAECSLTSTV